MIQDPPIWLIQLRAVILKEVRQIRADRRMIAMLMVVPFVQVVIFSSAVNFDVDKVPTVVVDHDHSVDSREHLRRVLADGTLTSTGTFDRDDDALHALDEGDASVAVIMPPDFHDDLLRNDPTTVQVILDGSDPNRANVAAGAVSRYFGEVGTDMARKRMEAAGRTLPGAIQVVPRVMYNPRMVTSIYMIPGVAAMLLIIVTTLITAMGLSREREMGTFEQVLVTPISPGVLLFGKIVPYVAIGLFDVLVALAAGATFFELPLRGNFLYLLFATMLYLLSTLGIGLFIATTSATQQQAFMGGFLFMLPAILLSGNMTPIRSMPEWLQLFTYLNPLRYFIEILRANLLKGAGLRDLWWQTAALGVYGPIILTIAIGRFRKRAI